MMEDLKRRIRRLSGPQLIELRRYINNWRPTDQPSEGSWIGETFESECKRLVLGSYAQPATKQLVRNHAPSLESFLDQACPDTKLMTKRVILATGIHLLYKDLEGMGVVAISPKVLANNLHRIPAVLDRAFPGYARNGILKMIVKRILLLPALFPDWLLSVCEIGV